MSSGQVSYLGEQLPKSTPPPKEISTRPVAPRPVQPPSTNTGKPISKPSTAPPPKLRKKDRPDAPAPAKVLPPRATEPTVEVPTSGAFQSDLSSALAHVVEDADTVIAPAPDASQLARRRTTTLRKKPLIQSLKFRRTIIPPLLVVGISFLIMPIAWLMMDRDSLLRNAGAALPITLCVVGAVLLLLAILNMLSVRAELAVSSPETRNL